MSRSSESPPSDNGSHLEEGTELGTEMWVLPYEEKGPGGSVPTWLGVW